MTSPATLYVVGPRNTPLEVARLTGVLTDLAAGPGALLEASDNAGAIVSCRITRRPSAACAPVAVPPTFAGGQVAAVGQAAAACGSPMTAASSAASIR